MKRYVIKTTNNTYINMIVFKNCLDGDDLLNMLGRYINNIETSTKENFRNANMYATKDFTQALMLRDSIVAHVLAKLFKGDVEEIDV